MSFLRAAILGARVAPRAARFIPRAAPLFRSSGRFSRSTYRGFGGRNPLKRYKFGKKAAVLLGGGAGAVLGASELTQSKKRKSNVLLPSQSDAQARGTAIASKMPRGTNGRRKTYRSGVYGPRSKALMPVRRMSTKRKRKPAYKAKKKTKRIKTVIKGVKKHYDDYGRIDRRYCNWLGVQHHGSHARMLAAVGESLIRAVLAKKGCYPATYSDNLIKWFPTATDLVVVFRRIEPNDGGDSEYSYVKSISGRTYQQLVDQFVFDTGGFRDAIMGDNGVAPNTDKVGYYPTEIYLKEGAGSTSAGQRLCHLIDVEASYITFSSYCQLKLQNKSLNDQGNENTDQVGQNPLEGKTYFFSGPSAKVRSDLQAANALYDTFVGEQLDETDTGIIAGPALTIAQGSDAISHPVRPQSFFKSCRKTTDLKMAPGGSGTLKLSFKFKGTLQVFCSKANAAYGKPGLGHVTWLAMEKKFRDTATATPDIILGYNRDCNLYANTQLRTKKYMLRTHNDTDMGSI